MSTIAPKNTLISYVLLCWLSVVCVHQVQAQKSVGDYQQSIDQISSEIKQLSEQLNSSKASRDVERDKLFLAEKSLKEANANIRLKQKEIDALEVRLSGLEDTLEQQLEAVDDARKTLASFIRKRYQNGQPDHLKSLLSQENPYAVGRLENYHAYYRQALSNSYREMTRKIQTTLELQAQVKDQTEQKRAEEIELERLEVKRKKQAKAREQSLRELDAKINSTQKSLATLRLNRSRLANLLQQLKAQAKKLQEAEQRRIREAQEKEKPAQERVKPTPRLLVEGGFKQQKGRLQCPLAIKPKRLFGARLAESGMRSEGLFYDTNGSTGVRSIFRGRVLFADFLKGYGLLIIVDHGDDHISLYGHNDRLLKKVGDAVEINETIAQTGVTGGLRSHGLYFEIRHNANPVDPSKWCR